MNSHERWQAERLTAVGADNPDQWMFTNSRGGHLDPDNLRHAFDRLGTRAGIDGLTPSALRHQASTELARARVDPSHRRRIMRHASFRVGDEFYTHLDYEDLRGDMERLASWQEDTKR